jgi:hypothetical protein
MLLRNKKVVNMESQNKEFRIDSQEDIIQQKQTRETEDDSQGMVVSD